MWKCPHSEKSMRERKKESRFLDLHKTSVSCLYFYPKTVQCVHSWHPFSFHCFQLQDHVQNFIKNFFRTWPFQTQTWNESNDVFQLTSMAQRKSSFGHHLFRSLFGSAHWSAFETSGLGTTHCFLPGLPWRTFHASTQAHDFAFDHCLTHHW